MYPPSKLQEVPRRILTFGAVQSLLNSQRVVKLSRYGDVLSHATLILQIARTLKKYSPEMGIALDRHAYWMDLEMFARIVCHTVQKKDLFFIQDYDTAFGNHASEFFGNGIPVTTNAMEFWCDEELEGYHETILLVLALTDNELTQAAIDSILVQFPGIFTKEYFDSFPVREYSTLIAMFKKRPPLPEPWDILPYFISRVYNNTGCSFFDMTYEEVGYSNNPNWAEFDGLVKEFAAAKANAIRMNHFMTWISSDTKPRLRQMAERLREISVLIKDTGGKRNDKNS